MKKNHPLSRKPQSNIHIFIALFAIIILFFYSIKWSGNPDKPTVSTLPIQNQQQTSAPNPIISQPVPVSPITPQVTENPASQLIPTDSQNKTGIPNVKFSVSTPPVNAILIDPTGVLWAAHEKGLAKIKEGVLTLLTSDSRKFPAPNATSLAHDGTKLWIGTFFGLFSTEDGRSFTNYSKADGIIHEMIYSLLFDGKILWVGTQNGLSFKNPDGKFFELDKKISNGGLADLWIGSLNRSGSFVFCGNDDGLSIWDLGKMGSDPNSWATVDMFQTNLPHNWILSQASFQNKQWVGTPKGLACLNTAPRELYTGNKAVWQVFNSSKGLPSDKINCLSASKDTLWIGTNKGLACLKNEKIRTFSEKDGLNSLNIRCIFVAPDSTLWIGTDNGIQAIDILHFQI
ncbi:MAG: hypothetical protein HQM08_06110 [Candidatus Riflebacteria bacterium]|nr:hypothetical protein [Candidatus Riflebacteria bacterium]